eukprot:4252631-Amphidinium_carterae.1
MRGELAWLAVLGSTTDMNTILTTQRAARRCEGWDAIRKIGDPTAKCRWHLHLGHFARAGLA